jgi:hypothetical protein
MKRTRPSRRSRSSTSSFPPSFQLLLIAFVAGFTTSVRNFSSTPSTS